MAEDANAAIRGAFEGGATEVVVNDSHGSQRNLLPEDLDPRARLISHSFKRHGMVEGLDETFDAVIFVGYHAKADSPRGLFAHTGSGVVKDVQVNGKSAGEGGLNTLMAQWFGVPVVLITRRRCGGRAAEGVDAGHSRRGGEARHQHARGRRRRRPRRARDPGRRGGRRRGEAGARTAGRYKVRMQLRNFTIPEVATAFREIQLVAPDTVEFTRESMPEAYRIIRVLYRFINPD